jgi:hypothetical protein
MHSDTGDSSGREQRVNEAIAAYVQAVDAGQTPDRGEFLARHADLAAELEAFFADRDRFRRHAEPLGGNVPDPAATVAPDVAQPAGPLGTVRYFGDYELLAEIARGGMGVVFKARQVSLDRLVALKMILAGQLASPADVQRFRTEAKASANLKHANIVAIHEVGEHEGQHFFSMDYIAGKSLAQIIRENPLPAARAARYVQTVAEAIHHAHQLGTLHRDLKPSNVLIDEADRPHVTDFGLAKRLRGDAGLTMTGQVLGTPSYMPPEQAAGRPEQVGPASDVYSLGALLYELLTGRPPFRAESVFDTIMQVVNTEPVPPRLLNAKVPRELDTICLKCLEKDAKKRYGSAQELADDLGRYLTGEPIRARPPSIPFAVRHWVRQNLRATGWTVGTGLIAGVLMSSIGLGYWAQMAGDVRHAYGFLPSLDPPWVPLPLDWSLPGWLGWLGLAQMVALMLWQGFLAALLVRPANTAGDVAVGAGSGLVCGLAFFTLALGPLLGSLIGIGPSQNTDLWILTRGSDFPDRVPPGKGISVVQTYPDLGSLDEADRYIVLRAKIVADLEANGTRALWIAMGLSMFPVPVGIVFALLAGLVLRRGDRPFFATLWDYHPSFLVISFGAYGLFALVLALPVALGFFPPGTPWWFMLDYLPFVAADSLRKRHRKLYHEPIWRRYWMLTAMLIVTGLVSLVRFLAEFVNFMDECTSHALVQISPWPWCVDALVYAVTLLLVVRYLRLQRDVASPEP